MSMELQVMVAKFETDTFIMWDDNYSVGVKEIDDQHKKLFDLINQTHQAMVDKVGKDQKQEILDGLVNYTVYHFDHEEGLMRKAEYDDYDAHIEKHKKLVGQVQDFHRKFTAGDIDIDQNLMKFLKDWLSNHIMGTDKFYGATMNAKGIY